MKLSLVRHTAVVEMIAILIVFLVAARFAGSYAVEEANAPQGDGFWIRYSVGLGLGKGVTAPNPGKAQVFDDFVDKKRPSLALEDIPQGTPFGRIHPFAETHLYLIYLCGWIWQWFGISTASLGLVFGLLYATACVAAYGIFRLGMNRAFALTGALLFALTPVHLTVLPHLRDYSKAPFVLGLIFFLGLMLRRTEAPKMRAAVLLGAAAGACIGIGLGMRQDLLVCLLPAVTVLAIFMPGRLSATWKQRLAAVAAMAVVFVLTSWPILDAMRRGGSNSAHNILGGFSEYCTDATGYFDPGAQLEPIFQDSYISQTVKAHGRYVLKNPTPLPYLGIEYDAAGRDLVKHYAMVFPENLLLRAVAMLRAVLMIVPLEFGWPSFPVTPTIQRVVDLAYGWWYLATRAAPYALAAVSLVFALRNLRLAFAFAFLVLFFGMYPVLQYHPRHTFHLSFFTWWLALFILHGITAAAWRLRRAEARQQLREQLRIRHIPWRRLLAAGVFVFTVGGGFLAVLGVASSVQRTRSEQLITQLRETPRTPVKTRQTPIKPWTGTWISFQPEELFTPFTGEDVKWGFQMRYIAVELGRREGNVPVFLQYDSDKPSNAFSFRTDIVLSAENEGQSTWFYLPVYARPDAKAPDGTVKQRRFLGFAVPEGFRDVVKDMYLLETAPALPLYARLPESAPAYAATRAKIAGYVPLYWPPRAALGWRGNRIADGSLETWLEKRGAPASCQPPVQLSSITWETQFVRFGSHAVKQVWNAEDMKVNPLQLFGVYAGIPEPGADFDLCLDAFNQTSVPLGVGIWLVHAPEGQTPEIIPLEPAALVIPPNNEYAPYHTTFHTPETLLPDTYLLFTTFAPPGIQPGQAAYWDGWRCRPTPKL